MSIGVHRAHCCQRHGCKYGNLNCPVAKLLVPQDDMCEFCFDEIAYEWKSIMYFNYVYDRGFAAGVKMYCRCRRA